MLYVKCPHSSTSIAKVTTVIVISACKSSDNVPLHNVGFSLTLSWFDARKSSVCFLILLDFQRQDFVRYKVCFLCETVGNILFLLQ